ncbi:hypothetical protein Mal15_62060 [Stieleria maiorica]|uniref:Uncharacterized protein n=1 Tax=Stieleria maiorica TaxID=2795974 RepID=A0A5B9MLA2_9BACT|nr:hypothetical protein Mal15_62060 [Stieleria maiorica]
MTCRPSSFPGSAWERDACVAPATRPMQVGGGTSEAVRPKAEPWNECLLRHAAA